MKRLQAHGAVLILPLALMLLLIVAPALPTLFQFMPAVAAAALPATATPEAATTGQAIAIAQDLQTPATTSTQLGLTASTTAETQTARATQETMSQPPPTPGSPFLPSARPLNAPEVVTASSTGSAKPTPTVPAPTPTPSSPYRLPWPGKETLNVLQGNNSAFSHTGLETYAWDFAMDTGSVVEAARGGTVRYVREDSNAGGGDVNLYGWTSNYVVIDHGDGTSGLYMHLMYHGVLVQVGQRVEQGQPIALSGSTGFATGPHLHFMVERTDPGAWYDQALPITFADVASDGGVPQQDRTYTSGNATNAYWRYANVVDRVDLPPFVLPRPTASVVPGVQGTGVFTWPLGGPVISPATAEQPIALIGGAAGTNVVAADTGTVVFADTDGLGFAIVIDHGNGLLTAYSRLARSLVPPGAIVQRGQPIGVLGQLIPGLPVHFAVALYEHGQPLDPITRFRTGLAPAPLPQVQTPNLVGMTPAQVAKAIAGLPITVSADPPAPSTTIATGLVVSQQPAAGSLMDIHSALHTSLSSGPATPTPVPTVTPAASTTTGHSPSAPATGAAQPSQASTVSPSATPSKASPSLTATPTSPAKATATAPAARTATPTAPAGTAKR